MSQLGNPANSSSSSSSIPVSEAYWSLVDKADRKFSKIRDLPYYERNRYEAYFHKAFKLYSQLWKLQQENRQKLVEAGLKRWEIGEIASRIAQLYFGQYMRTSEANYLSESYVFYEAIFTREYFKEGLLQDASLANRQLRFLSRFLMVCLLLNRREMVHQLANQLKMLLDDCKRTFQEKDVRESKLVVQEIMKFLKADTAFMNIRPFRYSVVLEPHPDSLTPVPPSRTKRYLRLQDAILSSYHPNEVKFSELTLDTFRMIQCLEWEPSGSFYRPNNRSGQNGGSGPSRSNFSQHIVDPTLPSNPRKSILYRPSVTHFLAVLATICEEMPNDGVLLIYLSASGIAKNILSSPAGSESINDAEDIDKTKYPCGQVGGGVKGRSTGCLSFGARGKGGLSCIYPSDILPFTRRPFLLVIDSDVSEEFETIHGSEKGEPAAMLFSPSATSHTVATDYRHGSLFTFFLTAPLHAFCLLLGISGSDVEMDTFNKAENVLSSSLSEWGQLLVTSENLNQVWAQILNDPFIRRLLLRFIFCRTVLALYAPTIGKNEYVPRCVPSLPSVVDPTTATLQSAVMQIANIFGVSHSFVFSENLEFPENKQ
ncbi:protein SCAI homolog [Cucurbita maxima]|uniref:Protein SCAI homolog n=1 Tax=Cucurbita maxima TaxID=3661 RepID=A0A6J1KV70_CUCMA|nr:protein SCAI homolog [Cucurbita maxima]